MPLKIKTLEITGTDGKGGFKAKYTEGGEDDPQRIEITGTDTKDLIAKGKNALLKRTMPTIAI